MKRHLAVLVDFLAFGCNLERSNTRPELFLSCLNHFLRRAESGWWVLACKRSENLLCSPSSSSFNCYCRLKILNSLKLCLDRIESGRKVVFYSEHGTTRPTRGVESRNPMSSGKWNIVLFYPYWCYEQVRAAGGNVKGWKVNTPTE